MQHRCHFVPDDEFESGTEEVAKADMLSEKLLALYMDMHLRISFEELADTNRRHLINQQLDSIRPI